MNVFNIPVYRTLAVRLFVLLILVVIGECVRKRPTPSNRDNDSSESIKSHELSSEVQLSPVGQTDNCTTCVESLNNDVEADTNCLPNTVDNKAKTLKSLQNEYAYGDYECFIVALNAYGSANLKKLLSTYIDNKEALIKEIYEDMGCPSVYKFTNRNKLFKKLKEQYPNLSKVQFDKIVLETTKIKCLKLPPKMCEKIEQTVRNLF